MEYTRDSGVNYVSLRCFFLASATLGGIPALRYCAARRLNSSNVDVPDDKLESLLRWWCEFPAKDLAVPEGLHSKLIHFCEYSTSLLMIVFHVEEMMFILGFACNNDVHDRLASVHSHVKNFFQAITGMIDMSKDPATIEEHVIGYSRYAADYIDDWLRAESFTVLRDFDRLDCKLWTLNEAKGDFMKMRDIIATVLTSGQTVLESGTEELTCWIRAIALFVPECHWRAINTRPTSQPLDGMVLQAVCKNSAALVGGGSFAASTRSREACEEIARQKLQPPHPFIWLNVDQPVKTAPKLVPFFQFWDTLIPVLRRKDKPMALAFIGAWRRSTFFLGRALQFPELCGERPNDEDDKAQMTFLASMMGSIIPNSEELRARNREEILTDILRF